MYPHVALASFGMVPMIPTDEQNPTAAAIHYLMALEAAKQFACNNTLRCAQLCLSGRGDIPYSAVMGYVVEN